MTTSNTNTIDFIECYRRRRREFTGHSLMRVQWCKWLPPNGFTGQVHHLDAKVGGTYKMSFTNFTTGKSHSFGGEYLELTPNERIRHTTNSTTRICPEK
jgi:hypothetical protein